LELDRVSKRYGRAVAVDELSLSVDEGELVTILGPSGSGKSTALRLIAGLERPDAGAISIAGSDMGDVDAPERGVSMVFQSFALFPHMTVEQNVGFGLAARKAARGEIERAVRETASWLGLEELLERRPHELSGGERQRVALARGLVRRPRVLLMDEPLSNLDARLRVQTRAEIRRVQAEAGITMVYVTHDQAEALSLGRRVAVIDKGRLEQYGGSDAVYERPANRFVAGFVGSPPMNLLPARLEAGTLRTDAGLELPVPPGAPKERRVEVVAGFRAEHVLCGPPESGGFPAVLELSERIGHERIWHLRAGERLLAARPPAGLSAAEGDVLGVAIEPEGVRLFDPDTGAAL
jgi:multiple sugar transport system ATP-binding protein